MSKLESRVIALELVILAAIGASTWWLWSFVDALAIHNKQDLWGAWDFVRLLLLGFGAAVVAVAAGEVLRRADKQYEEGLGSTFVFFARAMLVVQVITLLYCNFGPVRAIFYTGARVLTTYGMARDLPEPPAP